MKGIEFPSATERTEVVDTFADVFEFVGKVERTLSDGIQVTDLLQALQLEPIGREIINDFPKFWAETKKLDAELMDDSVLDAVKVAEGRLNSPLPKITSIIADFLHNISSNYGFVTRTAKGALNEVEMWKTFAT